MLSGNALRARRRVAAIVSAVVAATGVTILTSAIAAQAAGFTLGDVVVVRMGDGASALSSAAAPMFLDEYSSSGALVRSIAMPATASGANKPITNSGTATSNGSLTRSADGRFLTLGGYGAAVGTIGVTSSASSSVNRVIGLVSADGTVDTSTALTDAYSGDNFRGVVTSDGSRFWMAGQASSSSNAGIRYATAGATTSTQISTSPTNTRTVGIADGQLYFGSSSGAFTGVSRLGTGLPTTASTATLLASSSNPYGFALADRDPGVPGVDTAYIADETAGLVKYSFDGTQWTARGSFAGGIRGVTVQAESNGAATIFATTATSNATPNVLERITDTSAFNATITATATPLATAGTNTVFRGVALAPQNAVSAPAITTGPASTTISSGGVATLSVTATGGAPLSYQWYQGAAGDTSTPVGTSDASFTTPALTATTSYWVRVSNSAGTASSDPATVTVQPVPPSNTAPTITPATLEPVAGTVGDGSPATRTVTVADQETGPSALTVTATSSDPTIATASVSGTGATRTVSVSPVGKGYATITLTVSDGDLTSASTLRTAIGAALPSGAINHYGISDASAAVALANGSMVLGDDETNTLRTYDRSGSGYPTAELDLRAAGLALPDPDPAREIDIEAGARTGSTIYWLGSQGQNKDGKTRTNRRMLFSTTVGADGSTLSVGGSYQGLRDDLISWDTANGGTYGLAAAAARAPESTPSGLNIEGAEFSPDGSSLYLGFRGPLTSSGKALIVPVTNPAALVAANPATGVHATFGTPIELDLGGRGIRDIRKNADGDYLIVAGPSANGSGAAGEFQLYSWNGTASGRTLLRSASLAALASAAGSIESIVDVPSPLTTTSTVQVVTDSGDTVWYGDGTAGKDLTDREFMKSVSQNITAGSLPACSGAATRIGAVQGSGTSAAITGPVTVRGTVVGDYEGASPALRGFYLQDSGDGDDATSDGIFIFEPTNADTVSDGQVVEVTGTAAEYQDQTQITASSITSCGTTATVAPADVTLPVASPTALERYEGMLVRFHQQLTVTENYQLGRFGQVVVSSGGRLQQPTSLYPASDPRAAALQSANDLNQLIVDDATNAQNPDPIVFGRGGQPLSASNTLRSGDTVTDPVGVLTYTWAGNAASDNAYRLRPLQALGGSATFVAANPRPTSAPAVGGTAKVASANLLNYFNQFSGCTLGVGGAATDCRGAENQTEFDRQAAKEVAAITGLGADVVGVMEMQNNGYKTSSAIADLTSRLNAGGAGTWAFVDADAATGRTNALGTDAIKVGMLYRTDRVTPVSGTTLADPDVSSYERVPLAQTFTTPAGARFTVVVNHFKSKGCNGATGADLDQGDGQGCFNARRVSQANSLVSFIHDDVLPVAKDPDVLIVGDLNSYAQEDPILALQSAGYTNLIKKYGGDEAYSYVFDGQTGYLDQALASASLTAQATGAGDVHINADEPSVLDYTTDFKSTGQIASLYAPDEYRTSDHDPVLVGLSPVVKVPSSVSVTSSVKTAQLGEPVTFTATVITAMDGVTPTGTVQFRYGGVAIGAPVPVGTDGTAVSAPVTSRPVANNAVVAVYSGDQTVAGRSATIYQRVEFGFTGLTSPVAGSRVTPGSTVPVRFSLTDYTGARIGDGAAAALVKAGSCRITVKVTGSQQLAPACVKYNATAHEFRYDWATENLPRGPVHLVVTITVPGGAAQTRAVDFSIRLP